MAVRNMNIDFQGILDSIFTMSQKQFPQSTAGMANLLLDKAYQYWRAKAQSSGGWGERYANTLKIQPMTGVGGTGSVYVDEKHPDAKFVYMMENGVASWSIKDALLEGKAARRNKAKYGTLFVRVPFRYRTPSKMKKTSAFAGVMPNDIYKLVKGGATLKTAGRVFGETSKTPYLSGLKRYGGALHGQYMTFRTVSEKSQGWQYPKIPAKPIFPKVMEKVEKMIAGTMVRMIQGFSDDIKKEFS